ncbi:MAG: hypothetical protein CVU56_12345 [Deltaproteobacteria bacterium HGW-Deltaproteobacteria-14]|nr:MAG: hypothetical protein CVU56_12345 [Deltaproteobacteria bacterium HGW-Deltaproteobacteria-14]
MSAALTELVQSRLAAGAVRVPLLPQVAWKLLTLDEESDVRSFESLVYGDHALAAHVMRIANSVALAGRVPVLSLRQALVRLGVRMLREVAIVAAVADNVIRLPGYDAELRALWRHALRTALWTKVVAQVRGDDEERAFLSGLLVDVGRAVAFRMAVETALDQGRRIDAAVAFEAAESLTTLVGTVIVDAWELPEELRAVVSFAARPHAAGRYRDLVLVVGLGRWLAATEEEDRLRLDDHAALGVLGVSQADVRAIIRQSRRVDELLETFSL